MSDLPFITSPLGPLDWITLYAVHISLRKRESQPWELLEQMEEGRGEPPASQLGHRASSRGDWFGNGLARTCAEAQSRRQISMSWERGAAIPPAPDNRLLGPRRRGWL